MIILYHSFICNANYLIYMQLYHYTKTTCVCVRERDNEQGGETE